MDYVSYAGDLTPEQAWELLRENPDAVLVDTRSGLVVDIVYDIFW